MIGKIIVHGDTREQALARMRTALSETVIEGINTNVPLHRELMVDAKFMCRAAPTFTIWKSGCHSTSGEILLRNGSMLAPGNGCQHFIFSERRVSCLS
jgi:acetyl/propionyl-CoA carboxylase alpha subunit